MKRVEYRFLLKCKKDKAAYIIGFGLTKKKKKRKNKQTKKKTSELKASPHLPCVL